MWYVISFVIGLGIGAALSALIRKKASGATLPPEVIKTIVERTLELERQNKKTEEIIDLIDDLLKQ